MRLLFLRSYGSEMQCALRWEAYERPHTAALWGILYGAFLTQTDPAKLKALLEPLEAAIAERIQELADVPEIQKERMAR